MTPNLHKAIMDRTRLRNSYIRKKSLEALKLLINNEISPLRYYEKLKLSYLNIVTRSLFLWLWIKPNYRPVRLYLKSFYIIRFLGMLISSCPCINAVFEKFSVHNKALCYFLELWKEALSNNELFGVLLTDLSIRHLTVFRANSDC